MTSSVQFALCVLWAFAVGISVAIQATVSRSINYGAPDPLWHSFYVVLAMLLIGTLILIPPSMCSPQPWGKPRKTSLMSGFLSLPGFIMVWTSRTLGIELVLLANLFGLISTFLMFDLCAGNVKLSDHAKFAGVLLAIVGVCIDAFAGFQDGSLQDPVPLAVIKLVLVYLVGASYALQAKLTGFLAIDLGSFPRAAMVCSLVALISFMPICAGIYWGLNVPIMFNTGQLPMFAWAGFQSSFYIVSMAALPCVLGFTTSYMATLSGKLITGAVVDALGLTGPKMPITTFRLLSLGFVIFGVALFNAYSPGARQEKSAEAIRNNLVKQPLLDPKDTAEDVESVGEAGPDSIPDACQGA